LVIQTYQVCRRPDRSPQADRIILIFILGYGLFHWLFAIPVWDRYLLPLLPLLAILLARACDELREQWPLVAPILQFRGNLVFLALVLVSASWAARNGRTSLGSSPKSDQGAAAIATTLADAPYGTVLYDHWFSWQWRYHLFDKRVFVSWFPHARCPGRRLNRLWPGWFAPLPGIAGYGRCPTHHPHRARSRLYANGRCPIQPHHSVSNQSTDYTDFTE
jgi:hypothetical protein